MLGSYVLRARWFYRFYETNRAYWVDDAEVIYGAETPKSPLRRSDTKLAPSRSIATPGGI